MRIYLPLEIIKDNPYQTRRDYGDIETFAAEEILPFYPQRSATLGLQTPPHARLMHGDLPLSEAQLATIASAASTLPAEDEVAAVREVWASVRVELVFGHRRVRALKWLHFQALAQLRGKRNVFDEREEPTPAATIAAYALGFVPVDVVQLADVDMLREVHMENAGRKNPAAMEELPYLEHALKILEADGREATVTSAAKLLGMSRSRAANLWRLRDIDPELAAANVRGELSQSQLEELLIVQRIAAEGVELVPARQMSNDSTALVSSWETQSPQRAIELVREHGHSRNEIRIYIERLLKITGNKMIKEIAEPSAEAKPGIRQATCAGCPALIRDYCVDRKCYQLRSCSIARQIAAAELPGVLWSDKEKDFSLSYDEKERLRVYIETLNKLADDANIVVGYAGNYAYSVRPLKDDGNADTPRNQIRLGYRGTVPGSTSTNNNNESDRNSWDARRQRHSRYEKIADTALERIRSEVIERTVDRYLPHINRDLLDIVAELTAHWVEYNESDNAIQKLRKLIARQVDRIYNAFEMYEKAPAPGPFITNEEKAAALLEHWILYRNDRTFNERPTLTREWLRDLIGDTDLDAEMQADIWDLAVALGFVDDDDDADTVELDGELVAIDELDARAAVELEA